MRKFFCAHNSHQRNFMRLTSVILRTHGSLFHERFSRLSYGSSPVILSEICWIFRTRKTLFIANETPAEHSSNSSTQCDCSPSSSANADCSPVSEAHSPLVSVPLKVDVSTQTEEHPSSKEFSTMHPLLSTSAERACSPLGTPTEPASPSSAYSLSDDEYEEYNMEASNVPEAVSRSTMQDLALTDLLTIIIFPTHVKANFYDNDEELEFRHRISELLTDYKPLTSALFLALSYMERLTNRINTLSSFYWWLILCLLYAHQILDDFSTFKERHVEQFMNIDASFFEKRQRAGYKALAYDLRISQVDWVYFLDHIRRMSVGGLSPASTEAILQLIEKSLPIPGKSPTDEILNPLHRLEKALELDRDSLNARL
ncbi:hypothetical protein BDP27DRAFT_219140 [Rhodocollybia butyracea]|uniref:Uncharacterized protein n=1 Tax=Rhodocollybia butyracea TaxID=206335 RepID=A0A9P5PX14_9AGAR|nr:hypothetical protein BDP27DRAFT_219140 [Rhodocollybia butyracea]